MKTKRGRKKAIPIDPGKVEVLPPPTQEVEEDFIGEDFDISEDGETFDVEASSSGDDIEVLPAEDEARSRKKKKKMAASFSELVPYDSLEVYLREIGRFPVLSREEEKEVALKYYHEKDIDAARTLVTSSLWLVVKIAREYQSAARNLLDLIQEGNMGLMEAVKNFDPYRDVRFPSYASWWVKAYIIRYVIANLRLVKIGTTQAQRKLFFNLKKEKERLEREGFFPAPKLLAEKLNVRESDVVEMEQRLHSNDLSVHTPLGEDTEQDLLSVLPSPGLTGEDAVARKEMQQLLHSTLEEFAATLKDKEEAIFRERLLGEEKATLQDLAEKFSLSRERIRQIENRLRDRLKAFLIERMGPSIEQNDFSTD